MFQLYKKEHGMKKATLMIQGKITDSIEKVLEFEEDLGKIRALNYSKTVKGAAKKTYDSYTQEAQVLMLQIKDLQDEGKMLNDMIGRMPAGVKDGTDEEKQQFKDRKEAEQKRKDIVDKLNDKNAQWTGMSDDDKMQGGVGKSFMRGFGRGFDAKSFSKLKGVAPFDKLFNVMDKLNMVKGIDIPLMTDSI